MAVRQMSNSEVKVVISYAREDFQQAYRIYRELNRPGITPWLDKISILPGQRWRSTIRQSIRTSDFVLILLSSNSVTKKGFVQKEVKEALDMLEELPESRIFIIPVRLDACSPTNEKLLEIQWVDLFPSWELGVQKILHVIDAPIRLELGHIESLDAEVTDLRFFESGDEVSNERTYQFGFASSDVRYIYWELNLALPPIERRSRINFIISALWHRTDGTIYAKQTHNGYIEPDWKTSWHRNGWGSNVRGESWKAGDYKVELFVNDKKVASNWFRVFDE